MNNENAKAVNCPNCQGPAIKAGNEITCEKCDATFVVVKKEGAKVQQIGPIADHETRIKALEDLAKPKAPTQEVKQESEQEDDEL